jgi:PAS domain S-box-containing protein
LIAASILAVFINAIFNSLQKRAQHLKFGRKLVPPDQHGPDAIKREPGAKAPPRRWLLTPHTTHEGTRALYGDLTELNTCRVILDAVGLDALNDILMEHIDLLGTSGAIFERNGDYALARFSSGWCRFLDLASRQLCGPVNNQDALACGKWHCHESCWTHASKAAIDRGEPVDVECLGGIHLYAVPIRAGFDIVGSINFGYGDPPRDAETLDEISKRYNVDAHELKRCAESYESRPQFLIDLAKRRLEVSARMIGTAVERRRAEQAVANAARYTRSLIEASLDPLVTISSEGKITDLNEATIKITGYSRETLIGTDFCNYFTDPDKARDGYREAFNKGFVANYPLTVRRQDGALTEVVYNASVYKDQDGHVLGVFAAARDMTAQRRVEEALRVGEARYQSLFDATLDAIILLDPLSNQFISANPGALRLFGAKSEADLLFQTPWEHSPELQPDGQPSAVKAREMTEIAIRNGSHLFEWIHKRTDGSELPAEVLLTSVKQGAETLVYGSIRDISERKKAAQERDASEVALKRLNRTLRALFSANEALVRATTEQELFDSMCRVVVDGGGCRLAWIGVVDPTDDRSIRIAARAGEHLDFLNALDIDGPVETNEPSTLAIRTGEVQIDQDIQSVSPIDSKREAMLKLGFRSSISLPLVHNAKPFGSFNLYSGYADAFGPDEVDLFKRLTADLSYGFGAVRDHQERDAACLALKEALKATVGAIAAAVELRDAYTAGHQRQVAELSVAIAQKMGLEEHQIEGIFLAALIHDVGKINVPAEILSKPAKLTDPEYQIIKSHPQFGYNITKGIEFPWPIAQIILQHHERLDGSGYPNHLHSDEILLEAKVIGVADVVESMMSHRPYRPQLGLKAAIDEIESGKGRLYEPQVVDACIAVFHDRGSIFSNNPQLSANNKE